MIEMENSRLRCGGLGPGLKLWWWMLRATVGYGFRLAQAIPYALHLLVVGVLLARLSYKNGTMVPTEEKTYQYFASHPLEPRVPAYYPSFRSTLYALDTVVPIVSFGQRDHWRAAEGSTVRLGLWALTFFGWLLAGVFAAGLNQVLKTG